VLKGGVLLAAYAVRRPTRDVDIAARAHANDPDEVLELVREIASVEVDDGLTFDVAGASAEPIRDHRDVVAGSEAASGPVESPSLGISVLPGALLSWNDVS
jgi:hypothetical protein